MTGDAGHHHRSNFEVKNKPFKGTSKGKQRRKFNAKGRIDIKNATIQVNEHNSGSLSSLAREDRLNHAKQIRENKKAALIKQRRLQALMIRSDSKKSAFGAPLIVALLPMSAEVSKLASQFAVDVLLNGNSHSVHRNIATSVETGITSILIDHSDTISALDAAKVADVLLPFFSERSSDASLNDAELMFDAQADYLVSLICNQGVPCLLPVVGGSSSQKAVKLVQRYMETVFGDVFTKKGKVFKASDSSAEILRNLKNTKLRDIQWKAKRGYMLTEEIRFDQSNNLLQLSGYLRGDVTNMADRLIHITGVGDFQINKIEAMDLANGSSRVIAVADPETRDSLQSLCYEQLDELNAEDEDDFPIDEDEEDESKLMPPPARPAPRSHNEAWEQMLSEFDSDFGASGNRDETDSVLNDADSEATDGTALNLKFKMERDEMEFPDEVNTPTDVLAKVRFSKYRGLENFHTSPWETFEDEVPESFALIYRFSDFKVAQKAILSECATSDMENDLSAGMKVILSLEVPEQSLLLVEKAIGMFNAGQFVIGSTLFTHERKVSQLHFKVTRYDGFNEVEEPVQGKEPLQFHCGFRRLIGRPIYSEDVSSNDKSKIEKFFMKGAGQFCIASLFGRIHFGPANVLMFKESSVEGASKLRLVGTGTYQGVDPEKLLIKRIILTGYPFKVHKRKGVVRFMFFHPDDVRWFMPVKLWTKHGLRGQIDEPLGTKGNFKCSFNGFLKHHDTVCMSLYKRQIPPFQKEWFE